MQREHGKRQLNYKQKTNRTCWSLLGLPFDQVNDDQAVDIIDRAIVTKRKYFFVDAEFKLYRPGETG
jgi:hypothetical protein